MHILSLTCEDQKGIVAAVSGNIAKCNCNIEESSQFNDPRSNQFYMRVVFSGEEKSIESFIDSFPHMAKEFNMHWEISNSKNPIKTLIMVSQYDHCLHHLLYQEQNDMLPIEITAIVSNHETTRELAESFDIPFHYLPITKDNKAEQEDKLSEITKQTESELIVLARYMQILSEDFISNINYRVINIHHSFLPGFKGARPYHQAYERGVKSIGATAHFVTAELDEGPIITQNVVPVNHKHTPEKMQALGRDTESQTLAEAIKEYAERRVFVHDRRTIIL
ncbi:MAG: formyltetrahydrofolate deformylase [Pseudomonadota bacterium]